MTSLSFVLLACVFVVSHAWGAAPPLVSGPVIDQVPCTSDPSQSYALYLPSTYTPVKRWPIVYAFDPEARGKIPVERYKEVAEKYGYIIAGSNNSRNFSAADSSKAVTAMWEDTHIRLSIDEKRTYITGFSGGARMAAQLAFSCRPCQIAGVIAHGAGYPSSHNPLEKDRIPFFLAVGDRDFNWPEIITIRRAREDLEMPYRVRVYAGPHQWASAEIFQDAIEWMQLKAMQSGTLLPDAAFIELLQSRREAEANDAAKRGDAIAELNAYRSLVSDFRGLKDISQFEQKLTALKTSSALKAALKKEQGQIAEQAVLTSGISAKINALADTEDAENRGALSGQISTEMRLLKDRGAHAKTEEERLVHLRAYRAVWAQGIETGQAEFESRHFERAELYFRLMAETDDDSWPYLLLAETQTAMGRKKQALKDLREAVKRGLRNTEILENDRNLNALRNEPDFKKLIAEMSQ